MTAPIRVVIADDEPAARRGLSLLLAADPEFTVVAECADGAQTIAAVERLRPDLLFLDIQMPGCDGFEVLSRLQPEVIPVVVFVTAFDAYTLRAFDVQAVDYLLKPYSDSRFHAAASRARTRVRQREPSDLAQLLTLARSAAAPPTRIAIPTAQGVFLLPVEEIEWIEARGDYVRVHSPGRLDLVRDTISGFERRLPPDRFVRIHRSVIVNLARVRELSSALGGEQVAVLASGVRCRLSRSGRERLERLVLGS